MTRGQQILKVALATPLRKLFDYLAVQDPTARSPAIGSRVLVPFGKRTLVGIVMEISNISSYPIEKLKSIVSILDEVPLFPEDLCDFFTKAARYYHHPIGEVVFSGLPQSLKQNKPLPDIPSPKKNLITASDLTLNAAQATAVDEILKDAEKFQPFLLQGITGSGKTEVYLTVTEYLLKFGKQILVMVPEISLTPQTLDRFQKRFGPQVKMFHSQMTPAKRRDVFLEVSAQQVSVVIGTRSALFLPFKSLGLIIIDEEHDLSFKQQEGFRYSARDLAVLRAKLTQIPILLGSATPSFESLYNAEVGKYKRLILPERATNSTLPALELIDVRHKKLTGGLSAHLINEIKKTLEQKKQVLLFVNRRGYAPVYMCYDCGWLADCPRCEKRLTYHLSKKQLICHHCDHPFPVPKICPDCQHTELNTLGQGTEKVEEVLQQQFPAANLVRIDSDTTRKKGQLKALLSQAEKNEAQLLIGTQMLAKGHHFPNLTLVAVLDGDGGLFSADFRAQERMAQLLIQVSGRAGRVHHAGRVLIQTFHPHHPFMQQLLAQDYDHLTEQLLAERKNAHLPPFSHMALIRANHTEPTLPERFLQETGAHLSHTFSHTKIKIRGPIPSPFPKKQGRYHFQLLLQSDNRAALHQALGYSANYLENAKIGKKLRWSLDVDPVEMI